MKVNVTWQSAGPHTIYGKLAAKLGREPTNEELKQDVRRIFDDVLVARATAGKLKHQRK